MLNVIKTSMSNEETSVLGGSTGPRKKARPILIKQKNFLIDQSILAYHPGPVSPPSGDGSQLLV